MKSKIGLVLAGWLFSQVVAAEIISMPGSACRAANQFGKDAFENEGATGLSNNGTDNVSWVSCPLEKLADVKQLYVNVYHPDERTTFCVINRANSLTGAAEGQVLELTGSGNLTNVFADVDKTGAKPADVYGLVCLLSEGTILRGYDWKN